MPRFGEWECLVLAIIVSLPFLVIYFILRPLDPEA